MVELDFDLDRMLAYLVRNYQKRNSIQNHFNNNTDDLLSEARLAAVYAMKTYDINKKTKLQSYIRICVENRLKDLRRVGNHQVLLYYPEEDGVFENLSIHNGTFEEMEFDLSIQQVLSPLEYKVYKKLFVEDYTIKEITSGPHRILKNSKEVSRCLHRIYHKFLSQEKTQDQISMLKVKPAEYGQNLLN